MEVIELYGGPFDGLEVEVGNEVCLDIFVGERIHRYVKVDGQWSYLRGYSYAEVEDLESN